MTAYTSFSLRHEAVSAWKERRRTIEEAEANDFARALVGAHDAWERAFGPAVPQPFSWMQGTASSWAETTVDGLHFLYRPPVVLSDLADADKPGTLLWLRPSDRELLEVDSLERLGELLTLAREGE